MKLALVTGSSRGIGAAIARKLASENWKIIIHYTKDQDAAKAVASEIGEHCAGILWADLTSPEQTLDLFKQAEKIGPLSTLVNNAGIYIPMPFESDMAEWKDIRDRTFRINFEAPSELCYYASKAFLARGGGKILNVASRVGFRGEAGAVFYAASKAALVNLTRSLAVEFAAKNIGVFGIAPGWVETSMARDGMDNRLQEILNGIPLGRMASPEDCAEAANFLLSDGASYLSGQTIDINGASYFH